MGNTNWTWHISFLLKGRPQRSQVDLEEMGSEYIEGVLYKVPKYSIKLICWKKVKYILCLSYCC